MKKISAHSKTSLFLMEMIFVLLFLALSSAACIRIFAAAKKNHIQAQEWRHIQTLTTSVGEILENSDGTAKSFVSLFPDGQIQDNLIIMPAVRLPLLSMRFRQNSQMPTGRPPIRRIILPLSDNSARIILSLLLMRKSRHCFSPNHSLTLSSSLSA